jgi:hypothetical protein
MADEMTGLSLDHIFVQIFSSRGGVYTVLYYLVLCLVGCYSSVAITRLIMGICAILLQTNKVNLY